MWLHLSLHTRPPTVPFNNSAPLEVGGGGVPHHPPTHPPTPGPLAPLKDKAKFSSGPLANQKFSLVPLAPIGSDQKFSSVSPGPLKTQHHWERGVLDPPPQK